MKKLLAMLLLPLSLVPVALAVPRVTGEHESFVARYIDRDVLAAPDVSVDAKPVPAYRDRIPVLVYHGINDDGGRWNLTQDAFARQMAALDAAGFHTVSAADYAAFARGEDVDLPPRPILLTFDDARLDSFQGADAVLAEHDFRATMFAMAATTFEGSRTYLSPEELRGMQRSGRWDVSFHAGAGHTMVETAGGGEGPFYARLQDGESLPEFRHRVEADLDQGMADLAEQVPGATFDELFAVPYSDYGQDSGDARVSTVMAAAALSRFDAVFVQRSAVEPTRRGEGGIVSRFEPAGDLTPDALLAKLRRGLEED